MLGYVILLVISVGFLVLVFRGIKSFNNGQASLENRIENDPAYIVEKRVKARLNSIRWGNTGSFRHDPRYDYDEKYERYLSDNREVCVDFLNKGASMVCAHNTTDPHHNFNLGQGLYIYTPNAVFRKVKDFQSGSEIDAILSPGMGFGIKGHRSVDFVTVDKQTSVAKSAAIGGIIGGAAGAVVGAAYAMEKNNAGPTTKAVAGNDMIYNIYLLTEWIDTVFVNKSTTQFCPPPPKEYIQHETETYWILNVPAFASTQEAQDLINYLNKIVGHLAATANKAK